LQDSKFFRGNFSEKFLLRCTNIINELVCQPGQIIQETEDNQIYFLEKGKVEYYLDIHRGSNKKKPGFRSLIRMNKMESFGYHGFFTGQ
jgi:hypothetical protein